MNIKAKILRDKETYKQLQTNQEKLQFVWDYYKAAIITAASLLVIALIIVINNIGKDEIGMYAVLMNTDSLVVEVDDTVFVKTLEKASIDLEGKVVDVNDSMSLGVSGNEQADMETRQLLTALFTITDLDIFVAPEDIYLFYGTNGGFVDVREYLDEKTINRIRNDLFIYTDTNGNEVYGGVILHENSLLHQAGYYHNDVIIGAVSNAQNLDLAIAFINQLIND